MEPSRWSRWVTVLAVLLLAVIAAVVSYSHMYDLALHHGEPEWRAALFPLSVDGMIVASSMTLLSDARQGRRGGVLPWSLLIIGSGASLAANIAVADPTVWSRVIHAWPSFALIGAYELLMRHFRANSSCTRNAHAVRTQTVGEEGSGVEMDETSSAAEPEEDLRPHGRSHLRVAPARAHTGGPAVVESVDGEEPPPRVQIDAWRWTLANRREDGSLPSGREIAAHFDHQPRWGRLIKQWGQQGRFDQAVA